MKGIRVPLTGLSARVIEIEKNRWCMLADDLRGMRHNMPPCAVSDLATPAGVLAVGLLILGLSHANWPLLL